MDFSAIATTVLTRVFGEYVDGLDPANLEISILSGRAVMRNLKLKKTVLDKFNLAVTVKEGYLGEIDIRIPWTTLSSESAIIKLSDVHILAEPVKSEGSDDERLEKQYQNKLSRLNLAALMGTDIPEVQEEKKEVVQRGYFEELAMKIIDNVQVFFDDVHFRYEDATSNPGHPFAVGWTVESIHVRSTDSNWEPMFMSDFGATMHKLLFLTKLTTYFDTNPIFVNFANDQQFCKKMKEMIHIPGIIHQQSPPISGYVRARILKDRTNFTEPHAIFTILIHEVDGGLDMEEYECIAAWQRWFTNWNRKNNSVIPPPPPGASPLELWSYAFKAATQQLDLKWNWDYISTRLYHRTQYIELYKQLREKGSLEKLADDQKKKFEFIQRKYTFEDLLSWRKLANAAFKYEDDQRKEIAEKKKAAQASRGFFSSWFGSSAPEEVTPEIERLALSDLYKSIGFEEETLSGTGALLYPKDYVQTIVQLKLNSLGFKLQDKGMKTIIRFQMQGFEARMENLPAQDASVVKLSVGSVEVSDLWTLDGKVLPIIAVDSQKLSLEQDIPCSVFEVTLRTHPPDSLAETAIEVQTQPIVVTYSRPVMDKISSFFSSQGLLGDQIVKAKNEGLDAAQKRIESQLKYALETKPQVDISLNVHSLTLIVPSDATAPSKPALVFDTGCLKLKSDLTARSQVDHSDVNMSSFFYDAYRLKWSKLCAFSIRDYASWTTTRGIKPIYLFPPFDLDISLQTRQVPIITIPNFIFTGAIPNITINLAKDYMSDVMQVLDSVSQKTPPAQPASATPTKPDSTKGVVAPQKSVQPESETPTTEVAVNLKFEFTVHKFDLILLSRDPNNPGPELTPFAEIGLRQLECASIQDDNSAQFKVKVLGLHISDLSEKTDSPQYILAAQSVLDPSQGENFMEISMVSIEKQSPIYAGIEKDCKCVLDKVDFTLNRPFVATLLHIINEITDTLQSDASHLQQQEKKTNRWNRKINFTI